MKESLRVAVTGSRGKSSVVRLIHSAFAACGLRVYGRVTGVIPRELSPDGERFIIRSAGANVSEMKWWLSKVRTTAEAVVMENSAVSPELQGLCALWLKPQISVLTNIRPDHEEHWGPGELNALKALSKALPNGGAVVLPAELREKAEVRLMAEKKNLGLFPAVPVAGFPPHLSANVGLAMEVIRFFCLDEDASINAMRGISSDVADFSILDLGEGKLAFAFSANDVETTEELFRSTGWKRGDSGVIYNHRADRAARFRAFAEWMSSGDWREVVITGDRPPWGAGKFRYIQCRDALSLFEVLSKGLWIGCGNAVHGAVLELRLRCGEGGMK